MFGDSWPMPTTSTRSFIDPCHLGQVVHFAQLHTNRGLCPPQYEKPHSDDGVFSAREPGRIEMHTLHFS